MTTIITKNSSTASAVPLAADLVQGELAVNVTDKRLFTQNASDVVVELGTNPSSVTTASATITGGTVNGTSVGATTPSTGAFTTLSASGNVTLGDASTDTLNVGNGGLVKDASGNVGMGTNSPSVRAEVYGTEAIVALRVNTNNSGVSASNYSEIQLADTGVVRSYWRNLRDGSGASVLSYNDHLRISASGVEKARIDSSGNLLVGTTSQTGTEKFNVTNSATSTAAFIKSTHNTTGDITLQLWNGATRDTSSFLIQGINSNQPGNGQIFNVYANGNVANVNNSYGAISDVRLKENITDATPKLAQLNQVRIVNYNLIGDTNKQLGVVAQELEQIFPAMVDESPDYKTVTTVDKNGNEKSEQVATGTITKSVKYSVFVPMLIKAIQEQQAIITSLTARIAALEDK